MKQSREQLLATIEKLKKELEAIDSEPTILSMEITETVKFEVAKEDVGKYNFYDANSITFKYGWRLPTIEELKAMYEAKVITKGWYWSSTEYNTSLAYYFSFTTGNAYNVSKTITDSVRAVRTIE